jgi:hypothetical protein
MKGNPLMTDQSIEQEIQAKGLTAPRITPELRQYAIARVMRECDSELLMDILGLGE